MVTKVFSIQLAMLFTVPIVVSVHFTSTFTQKQKHKVADAV